MRRLGAIACFACVVSLAGAPLAGEPPPDVEFHAAAARPGGSPPLSEAVRLGDTLYLSGQLGVVPGTRELAPGGIRQESRQVMENIRRVLESHGHSLSDLVKCTVMLADMAEWQSFNEVYRRFFPDGRFPARSAFGVSGLALGARVEVECIAAATNPQAPPDRLEPPPTMRPIEDPPPDPEPEEDPPPPPPPPPPPSPPAAQILGLTSCAWGSDECNRCVPDVHAAMSELRTHGDVAGFNMGPAQDVTVSHHWQGIQRLGHGDGKLMAVSRSGSGVAFVMVEMGSRAGDGLRYRSNRIRTDLAFSDTQPPDQDVVIQEFPIDAGFNHAGGIQVVGKVLAVPYEHGDNHLSRVAFFDVGTRRLVRRLHQTELSSTAVYQDPGHAGAVAVGKLADQRYLMIVAGYDSRTADFYLSSTTSLLDQSTTWNRFFVRSNGFDRAFQAINLVTQCDGKLFLVGNYNTSAAGWGTDYFRWYELSNGTGSSVTVTLRGERQMVCTYRSAQQCNLVAAGGTYVDPQGRLLGYSTEHDNDGPGGSVKMEEFRGEFPQPCPTIDQAWAELYDDAGFGDRSVMIDFPDRELRNYENYDQVEGFEDKTSSARWCIPPGWRLRLFEHKNPCGGATRDLIGVGSRSNYDDVGFGDDASCSRWFNF